MKFNNKIVRTIRSFKKREVTMRDRFITRVLLPPFLILLIIGGLAFWQLNSFLRDQAVDDLRIAASSTAIRLEREIVIRETVLKNTADEISSIEGTYVSEVAKLDNDRNGCREYYLQKFKFADSPEGVCDVFSKNANGSKPSLALIEDIYIESAKSLQSSEVKDINQRLSAFKLFFPETVALLVTGENDRIVSSAVTGGIEIASEELKNLSVSALDQPLRGRIIFTSSYKIAIFAFPTTTGSVLAAYDVNNDNYIRPSWINTPINNNDGLAIVTENNKNIVYPTVRDEAQILESTKEITDTSSINTNLSGVQNIIVSEEVGGSDWTILIASPEAIVFDQLRNTQITVVFISGLIIVGFLWVGTFFIKKTTDSIAQLSTAAMVYGSGRFDYMLSLDESEKEFIQLAETMKYMAERISKNEQEIDEKNKEFISIATHELRSPMTSIIGYLSMLKDDLENKMSKQDALLFNGAYDGTIKLRDLVNDMLDAARLEGGREEFTLKKLEISNYINDCLSSMKIVAEQNKITLNYDDKNSGNVFADEAKLRIILNNFVSNAIKYNRHGGIVKVNHFKDNGHLITTIANNGPTIPEDQQAHMFEKFFRVDTPELKKITGTGIGMYVTKQYIVAMGGKVWFTSSPGQDTVFYFSLPMTGTESSSSEGGTKTSTPKPKNSKWIMRWRRHLQ